MTRPSHDRICQTATPRLKVPVKTHGRWIIARDRSVSISGSSRLYHSEMESLERHFVGFLVVLILATSLIRKHHTWYAWPIKSLEEFADGSPH